MVKNRCHKQVWEQMQLTLGKYITQLEGAQIIKAQEYLRSSK